MFLVKLLSRRIQLGEQRNVTIKKNIFFSFLIRGLGVAINLSLVSIAIDYVDPVRYGIWLTLTSIITWFTYFDFGMGNGLRNNLTTAIAYNEWEKAKKYVSTTYAFFILLSLIVFLLFFLANPHINWNQLLNIPASVTDDLHLVLLVLLGSLCVQFVLQLVNTVLNAMQQTAKAEFITLMGQVAMLGTLLVLKFTTRGSLEVLIVALNVAPLFIATLASVILYTGKYKLVAPSFSAIDFTQVPTILNVGAAFFFIQIGSLVLHQTDNVIITRVLGPEAVTTFNVTYKLYNVIILAFTIIGAPYWSAFTDAYVKKDYQWISKSITRLRKVWLFVASVIVPLFFSVSGFLFTALFPDALSISWTLSASMAVFVICTTCLSLNCFFLYGVGKLRVLLFLYLIVMVAKVPLGIFLSQWWGVEGVVASNIVAYIFMNTILWFQINKIVEQKAVGLWNR